MLPTDGKSTAFTSASGPSATPGPGGSAGAATTSAGMNPNANPGGGEGAPTGYVPSGPGAGPAFHSPPPAPRPRNQGGRRKALPIEPDPLYRTSSMSSHGMPPHATHSGSGTTVAAGTKRATDGGGALGANEPRKRKRVEPYPTSALTHTKQLPSGMHPSSHGHGHISTSGRGGVGAGFGPAIPGAGVTNIQNSANSNNISFVSGIGSNMAFAGTGMPLGVDADGQSSLIEFSTLPTSALYEYIIQYDLVPMIYPTPLMAEDPPAPAALLDPARMASRAPTPTPLVTPSLLTNTSRPRRSREAKEGSRRRSTRLLEEEMRGASGIDQVPVLADVNALHGVLATIVARHFRESGVREVETLASFLGAVKARRK